MIRWVVFVALLISSSVCGGCGVNWLGDPNVCIGDPSDPLSCPPTPAPTDEPPQQPQPASTLGPGCVDNATLLFPAANTVPSNYAGTMYVTVPYGEVPGSFLTLAVVQTNPANQVAQFEFGTNLVPLAGTAPSFVATPSPDDAGIYTSSNLPLVGTWPTKITLVDTRNPAGCAPFVFAYLNVNAARLMPRAGGRFRSF